MSSMICMNIWLKGCFFLGIQHTTILQLSIPYSSSAFVHWVGERDKRKECAQFPSPEDRNLLLACTTGKQHWCNYHMEVKHTGLRYNSITFPFFKLVAFFPPRYWRQVSTKPIGILCKLTCNGQNPVFGCIRTILSSFCNSTRLPSSLGLQIRQHIPQKGRTSRKWTIKAVLFSKGSLVRRI